MSQFDQAICSIMQCYVKPFNLLGLPRVNPLTLKFKKYILPTFLTRNVSVM